jgi:D-serine deaminase-like pyridoxal phosphate-dependent protein
MNVDDMLNAPVEPTTKGWPALAGALPLGAVGRQGWNLLRQDLPLPVAVLKGSALAHNSRWMRGFLERFDVRLCPHGKTTMAPQLFARQLADGAFGITVATVQQLMVCRRFGVPRVLLANQLIGRQAIRTVIAELEADPTFEFLGVVDSLAGVRALEQELRDHPLGRPVEVLLEGGVAGGRTGCRSLEEALDLARAVAAAPELALVGVEGFEDVMGVGIKDAEPRVEAFLHFLVEIARACAGKNLFAPGPVILSAGGSKHFDQVTSIFRGAELGRPVEVLLRSGCYFSHDSKVYTEAFARLAERMPEVQGLGPGLRPALELWAVVQSTPEPGLAVATLGKRDVGQDLGLPLALGWYRPGLHQRPQELGQGFEVTGLYDQHACLRVPPDSPLQVGDLVRFGISHPCTTFDKWRLLYVVDDDYTVTEAIRTFF